jgi:hypothetical protein
MSKCAEKKNHTHKKRENSDSVSPQKNAGEIRSRVKEHEKFLNDKFPVGYFVSEKYVTTSVGMVVEKIKGQRKFKHFTMAGVDPIYAAKFMYKYTVKVMWLSHPDKVRASRTEVLPVDYIKIFKEKKEL